MVLQWYTFGHAQYTTVEYQIVSNQYKDWRLTVHDLTWMVHDDNLSLEVFSVLSWLSLGIEGDVTSLDIRTGKTLNVETGSRNTVSTNESLAQEADRILSSMVPLPYTGELSLIISQGISSINSFLLRQTWLKL